MAARPNAFAAAIPVCGKGLPEQAATLAHVPVWSFQGAKDTGYRVANSRAMIKALQEVEVPRDTRSFRKRAMWSGPWRSIRQGCWTGCLPNVGRHRTLIESDVPESTLAQLHSSLLLALERRFYVIYQQT